jgi:hypothetical protein
MSNLNSNRVSASMTPAQQTSVKAALKSLQTNLPGLIGLTPEERMMIPKVAWNNKPFVEEAMLHLAKSPEFLPAYLNGDELVKDHTYFTQLANFVAEMEKLASMVADTQMLTGSELYVACLSYYKSVKEAALNGIPGAMPIYLSLKRRFEISADPTTGKETPDDTTEKSGPDTLPSDTPVVE